MNTYYKILQFLTIATFMLVLTLPFLNERLLLIPEVIGTENRKVAQEPNFDINKLDLFTKKYNEFYTDNFNLRGNFIQFISKFDFNIFNVSPVPKRVTAGKDGWLYATRSIPNYKGTNLFSVEELKDLRLELKTRSEWAIQHGVKYYLAVVPNKMNMYPENLPREVVKVSDSTRYDQLVALDVYAGVEVIDVRENLMKYKNNKDRLYQIRDDHWNELGAFYGYKAIENRLKNYFTELENITLDKYNVKDSMNIGNLAKIINLSSDSTSYVYLTDKGKTFGKIGEEHGYKPELKKIGNEECEYVRINPKGKKLKLLVIRDSFTMHLMRFFQKQFQRCVFIHDEWLFRLREDIIEIEKPDIVLNIMLETSSQELLNKSFSKTPGMYYRLLSKNNIRMNEIKESAKKENVTKDYMLKKVSLWYFNDYLKQGKRAIKDLSYYEFLFEVNDEYFKKSKAYANKNNLEIQLAIKKLAKKEYEKNYQPKTVDQFYKNLTSNKNHIERIKIKAKKENISLEEMTKLTCLWLYHSHWNEGHLTKETLLYFQFLFEVNKKYRKRANKYSEHKGISFNKAVQELAEKAMSGQTIR